MRVMALGTILLVMVMSVAAQQAGTKEPSAEHCAAVASRGDQEMGFSHEKTAHHFRLFKDGGTIEMAANDTKDAESRDAIRMHLSHIAQMFSNGNFNAPMFIHDTTPPGVPVMTELRSQIHYRYQETDSGAQVRIQTANAQALKAIHDFLRFQISEHQTGDSAEVTEDSQKE
jgi:hypothetical protein